jgi:hypothetical protein
MKSVLFAEVVNQGSGANQGKIAKPIELEVGG